MGVDSGVAAWFVVMLASTCLHVLLMEHAVVEFASGLHLAVSQDLLVSALKLLLEGVDL